MTAFLSPLAGAGAQFFTNAGVVLSGGQLFTFIAGSTTPQATWVDSTQNVQNPNPIILNSAGRPPNEIWLQNGAAYKFVLKDSNSNTLGTWDNIVGINVTNFSQSEWVLSGFIITFVSTNVFSVPGDQTGLFQVNRRVQYTLNSGTFYGYVSASSFDGINTTTVTVVPDSTALDNTVSVVNYALISATNTSIPQQFIITAADKVPTRSGATTDQFLTNNGVSSAWSALFKTGIMRFADSSDTTKRLAFNAASITTGTTRTATVPDRDISINIITRSPRTSNTIIGVADAVTDIDYTSGTFAQTFSASSTLKNGWYAFFKNSGTGTVTLTPNGAETIDGAASLALTPGSSVGVMSDGSNLFTFIKNIISAPQLSVSTSQLDKTSNTTLSAITGLTATLVSGGVYKFTLLAYMSSTTPNASFAMGGTATATSFIQALQVAGTGGGQYNTVSTTVLANKTGSTVNNSVIAVITGTIVCNAGGTFIPQFSQDSSSATTSSILVNSTFDVERIS